MAAVATALGTFERSDQAPFVNTDRTRLAGRFGAKRDHTGRYGKADISEQGRKVGYFRGESGRFRHLAVLEWGSRGRQFKSLRPDLASPCRVERCGRELHTLNDDRAVCTRLVHALAANWALPGRRQERNR